jgi:hypothetical protein
MSSRCICISLFAFCLLGCREAEEAPLVRITPAEFFSGELKRLKPHVDFHAACFKITTSGSVKCRADIEMWCDGKRVDEPRHGAGVDPAAGEVTLSWRKTSDPRTGKVYHYVVVGGLIEFGRTIEEPVSKQKIEAAFGPVDIRQPVELQATGDSAIVWAVGTGHGAFLEKPKDVKKKKMLQTAPWVLILRLTVEKKQ